MSNDSAAGDSPLEATISALILSLGSSAAMALGMAPDPNTGETKVDKKLAKFNIDMLLTLQEKTKSNLSDEEDKLINSLIRDLQVKFVQAR